MIFDASDYNIHIYEKIFTAVCSGSHTSSAGCSATSISDASALLPPCTGDSWSKLVAPLLSNCDQIAEEFYVRCRHAQWHHLESHTRLLATGCHRTTL